MRSNQIFNKSSRARKFLFRTGSGFGIALITISVFGGVLPFLITGTAHASPTPVALLDRGVHVVLDTGGIVGSTSQLTMSGCTAHFAPFTYQDSPKSTLFNETNIANFAKLSDSVAYGNQGGGIPGAAYPNLYPTIGDLNPAQVKYIFDHFNQTVQAIEFSDFNVGGVTGPKCSALRLVPVSDTEWRGALFYCPGCTENANRFITFTKNASQSATTETVGNFQYYVRTPDNTNSYGNRVDQSSNSSFVVDGSPGNTGNGNLPDCSASLTTYCVDRSTNPPQYVCGDGKKVALAQGPAACGTLTGGNSVDAQWKNILQIQLSNGDIYQRLKWDSSQFYFLWSSKDATRNQLSWSNAKNKDPDPIVADANGKKNCVPYIQIGNVPHANNVPFNFSGHDTAQLQQRINALPGWVNEFYDFTINPDPNTECQPINRQGKDHNGKDGNGPQTLNSPSDATTGATPLTWFFYDATSDSFKTLLQDGDSYEKPYLGTYVKDTRPGVTGSRYVFTGGTSTSCKWLLFPQSDPKSSTSFTVKWELRDNTCQDPNKYGSINVLALSVDQATFGSITDPTVGAATDNTPLKLDCQWSWNPFKLSWLICPIVDLAKLAVDALDKFIQGQLKVDVVAQFGSTEMEAAWSGFRTVAFSLLGLIGLVMILSQAFSFGPFDAYTIRKVLPRLVIAVIAISLSWQILQILVTISNDVGSGISGLISAPFSATGGTIGVGGSAGNNALGAIGLAGAAIALGALGLLSLAVTALLAVLVAFVTITFRNLFLMMLIIMAPLGIIFWILPGTQRAWKFWSSNLLSVLLAYPIIAGFITIGRVFAAVAVKNDPQGFVSEIMAFIAYFGPYFMLPAAFRLAGGIMATASGAINGRAEKGFAGLQKYRGGKFAENRGKLKAGNRFSDRNALSRGFNRTSAGLGTGVKGRFGLGARGSQAIDQARRSAMPDLMKSREFAAIMNNDDALMAATYDSAAEAEAALTAKWGDAARAQRAVAATQASIGFGRPQALAAAQQLVSTGTGYQTHVNAATGRTVTGMEDMVQTLARASGGNSNTAASLAGFANSETKKVGRADLAPSFGALNGLVQESIGGQSMPTQMAYDAATVRAARGMDAVTLLRGKPEEMRNLSTSLNNHLQEQWRRTQDNSLSANERGAAMDEVLQTTAQINQLDSQKTYGSQENQEIVNGLMNGSENVRRGTSGGFGPITPGNLNERMTEWITPPGRGPGGVTTPGVPNPSYDPTLRARYDQLSPPPRSPNDPNLP
jgi:hypothetical protein